MKISGGGGSPFSSLISSDSDNRIKRINEKKKGTPFIHPWVLLVYSRGPLYFLSFLTEAAWSAGRCIPYNPPRNGRESLRKKRAQGGTFSPLKGICMPSQNHCVCIYTILLILCGWYAYQPREEAAPADKVTGWSGQRSAVLLYLLLHFSHFLKEENWLYKSSSQFYTGIHQSE